MLHRIAPDSMSGQVRTLPPDTSEYVEQMRQFQKTEESENCRAEIEDNIEKISLGCELEVLEPRYTDDFVLKLHQQGNKSARQAPGGRV